MKLEMDAREKGRFTEEWPGMYEIFSHLEFACGIPHSLFLITTLKENGTANAAYHSWSSFISEDGEFYAILPGLHAQAHTLGNIRRTGEFCVNFLAVRYHANCLATITKNGEEVDEIAAGGLTAEPSATLACPRVREAFLTLECRLDREIDISGNKTHGMVVGKVIRAAAGEEFTRGTDGKYGEAGFCFNINEPFDWKTGKNDPASAAFLSAPCAQTRTAE